MEGSETWRSRSGLADWIYRPLDNAGDGPRRTRLESAEDRRRWILALLAHLPALLGDFAHMGEVEVATLAKGERAFKGDLRKPDGATALLDFVGGAEAVVYMRVDLTLACLDRSHQPTELERGAMLWINFWLTDSGALDPKMEDPIYLRMQLNTDIYAPLSRGRARDNAILAALNAPRLAGFLERIERDVPAELLEIDAEDYPGMIGPRGFIGPVNLPRDA